MTFPVLDLDRAQCNNAYRKRK